MAKFIYTEEHIKWAKENQSQYDSYDKIAEAFNLTFDTMKSTNAIQQFLTKKAKVYLNTERKNTHYTQEEDDWLLEHHKEFDTFDQLTEELNKRFSNDRKVSSVKEKCNKGLRIKMGNMTTYKKGHVQEQLPIGTIRKSNNGVTYIKVKDSHQSNQTGYQEPYWMPIQKKMWIDHFGEVEKGKMVIFLDGNRENLDIKNLYCINRKISVIMARNRWYKEDAVLTLTAIKWCELFYAIHPDKNSES